MSNPWLAAGPAGVCLDMMGLKRNEVCVEGGGGGGGGGGYRETGLEVVSGDWMEVDVIPYTCIWTMCPCWDAKMLT